ncbi:MAG: IS607 family transposase [Deltaproteobacteria bacterium]|nr:IS607 family transposase [Deltaproteobacteria bacterium]
MWQQGRLPVPATQLPTGTIIVEQNNAASSGAVAIYARVSSHDRKTDIERQVGRLTSYAVGRQLPVSAVITEVASGLNGRRPRLLKLLADPSIKFIIVEHRERLVSFGFEYIEMSLASAGRKLIVVDEQEIDDDLVPDLSRDMIDILTSFCARLYGRRGAKRRAHKAFTAAADPGP